MMSAAKMSDAIRMKRKKVKEHGLDRMIDTAPGPQMNPQDVYNLKHKAQIEETLDIPEKMEAPSDPADAHLDDDSSQKLAVLERKMAKVKAIFDKL